MNTTYLLAACSTAALAFALTLFAADPRPTTTSRPATTATKPAASNLPAYVNQYVPFTFTNGDGKTLNYRLFIPEGAKEPGEKNKFPLILFLHGSGGSGDNNTGQLTDGKPQAASLFVDDKVQSKYPCFILAPQCPKKQTWGGIDFADKKITPTDKSSEPLDLTLELLTTLSSKYPIDTNRLYITGLSLGGFGTWTAITRAPDTFAAAAPVCGGAPESVVPTLTKSKIPIWNFHGDKDNAVNVEFSRSLAKAFKDANAEIKYTEYRGVAHNSWNYAYGEKEFLPWLFAQKRTPAK